jgi:acyl carrier protein
VAQQDEIRSKVQEIMIDTFDLDELEINDAMTAADIEEWDSLSHVRLVVAVERAFKIRFANAEIEALANVGDFVKAIEAKTA